MRIKALWLAAGLLAVGLIAAGCGGDDDNGADDGGEALSKEDFVAQANQICEDGNAVFEQAGDELGENPSPEEIESFATDTLVPNVQDQIDDIRDLGIPEGDEDEVNAILDDSEEILGEVEDDPSQITGGGDPFAEVNPRLRDYGLTECAG